MSQMFSQRAYGVLVPIVRAVLRILHPFTRIEGTENIPEGAAVLCANHSGLMDPVGILAFGRLGRLPRTMAKKELFTKKLLARFFYKFGAFPVDRQGSDITAIKIAFQTLKEGNKLLIFPEGTRIRKGKISQAHSGANLIANRMKAPLVPIYLSSNRFPFSPVKLIIGKAYYPHYEQAKPSAEELRAGADALMERIYEMGEKA